MLDFQIDEETKELLREFVREIGILNEHLLDVKTIVAGELGWRIKEKNKKGGLNENE